MSDVHISDVEALHLRLPELDNKRTDSSKDALVVRITTDSGAVGIGEVDSSPLVAKAAIEAPSSHTLARGLRELLIGADPFDVEALWRTMYEATLYIGREGAVIHAMAGVDLALWDLKGKILGKPVHELLRGSPSGQDGNAAESAVPLSRRPSPIRAYASHMFDFDPATTAARAAVAAEAGFSAVKFGWEPFGTDPELDVAFVKAIRGAVGDEVGVCIDAGLAWDVETAIERCKAFEPYQLTWLEEPLHPDDLDGYARLCTSVPVPIAAGEEESTMRGFTRLIDEGHIRLVQIDPTRVGLTQALRIARYAAQRGLRCANHCFTTSINVAASVQLLLAIDNAYMLEYPVEPSPLRDGVVKDPVRVVDGDVVVPDGPGLGVELDEDGVSQFLVRT